MQVDFSKLKRDRFSCIEPPTLILMNKSGLVLGPLAFYHGLKMELKYNELSEVTFELPAWVDGNATPLYNDVVGEKLIRIDPFGIFVISNPTVSGDGLQETKSCTAYSLEYELAGKQVTFGAGTYPLYDPLGQQDTILGMVLERTRHWKVGSVPASLYGKYRTFDQTDITALDFLLTDVQKSYGCVFVFDTYSRAIHVVDANDKTAILPIYMSFDNLLQQVDVNEVDTNMATRVAVSGADGVSIRNVNPTGTNEIIHLGYAISQGDISEATAQRYLDWQNSIQSRQAYYTSLVAMRNSSYARYLTEKARLTDLEGELTSLDNLRSVLIQGRAMATEAGSETEEGTIRYFDARLEEVATQYREKQNEIDAQKELLEDIDAEYDQYGTDIKAINDELRYESYFSKAELEELDSYLIDGSFENSTFATFDVDVTASGDSFSKPKKATLSFTDVTATDIQMTNTWECGNHHSFAWTGTPDACPQCGDSNLRMTSGMQRRILALSGGSLSIQAEDYSLDATLISGTIDHKESDLVFTAYLGSGTVNATAFPSGNLSCVCKSTFKVDDFLAGMEKIVDTTTDPDTGVSHDDVTYYGKGTISTTSNGLYFTRNVTEYQQYSVEQELYDYAMDRIDELAYPTFEFEVKSGNILWSEELEPLKNILALGKGVYLQLNEDTLLKPMILEIHLDFEQPENFSIIFSNEFQIKRPDKVNELREILSKAQSTSRTLDLSKYEFGKLNTSGAYSALENFLRNGSNAAYQQLLAGSDQEVVIDGSGLSIKSPGKSEYIKLNNGMIALIDDEAKTAQMAMGHFYNTSTQQDYYGVLADVIGGTLIAGKNLHMECLTPGGQVTQFKFDGTGAFLNNSRMYLQSDKGGRIGLDPNTGFIAGISSLFTVADTGVIHPSCLDDAGKLILDKDGFPQDTNVYIGIDGNAYFRGNIYANDGVFNGMLYAKGGEFTGTLKATTLDGRLVGSTNGAIEGVSLNIGNGNFTVSQEGRVVIKNGSISWGAVTGTEEIDRRIQSAQDTADDASDTAERSYTNIRKLANGTYTGGTFIDGTHIEAPYIYGGQITGVDIYGGTITSGTTIDVGTDAHIGNNLYLGGPMQNGRSIIFNDNASISNPKNSDALVIACLDSIQLQTGQDLDLSGVGKILWGSNAPHAVFA